MASLAEGAVAAELPHHTHMDVVVDDDSVGIRTHILVLYLSVVSRVSISKFIPLVPSRSVVKRKSEKSDFFEKK